MWLPASPLFRQIPEQEQESLDALSERMRLIAARARRRETSRRSAPQARQRTESAGVRDEVRNTLAAYRASEEGIAARILAAGVRHGTLPRPSSVQAEVARTLEVYRASLGLTDTQEAQ